MNSIKVRIANNEYPKSPSIERPLHENLSFFWHYFQNRMLMHFEALYSINIPHGIYFNPNQTLYQLQRLIYNGHVRKVPLPHECLYSTTAGLNHCFFFQNPRQKNCFEIQKLLGKPLKIVGLTWLDIT